MDEGCDFAGEGAAARPVWKRRRDRADPDAGSRIVGPEWNMDLIEVREGIMSRVFAGSSQK